MEVMLHSSCFRSNSKDKIAALKAEHTDNTPQPLPFGTSIHLPTSRKAVNSADCAHEVTG